MIWFGVLLTAILVGYILVGFYVFHMRICFARERGLWGLPQGPLRRRFAPLGPDEQIRRQERLAAVSFDNPGYLVGVGPSHVLLTDRRLIVRFLTSWPGLCLAEIPLGSIVGIRCDVRCKKLLGPKRPIVITYTEGNSKHELVLAVSQQNEWLDDFIALRLSTDRT